MFGESGTGVSGDETRRLFAIIAAIFIMTSLILIFGPEFFDQDYVRSEIGAIAREYKLVPTARDVAVEAQPMRKPDAWNPEGDKGKTRTFDEYFSRREYPGAPPMIPHPVDFSPAAESGKLCVGCHMKGGYVPKYKAFAPVTPHPKFTYCRQCHVPTRSDILFRESDWASVQRPDTLPAALPLGPPPIPHSLQMRENCLACHSGPSSIQQIRTPHPERGNCRQCHVPRLTEKNFERDHM